MYQVSLWTFNSHYAGISKLLRSSVNTNSISSFVSYVSNSTPNTNAHKTAFSEHKILLTIH